MVKGKHNMTKPELLGLRLNTNNYEFNIQSFNRSRQENFETKVLQ